MSDPTITGLLIAALFFLLGTGVWIGLTLAGVAWIGMQLFSSRPAGDAMALTVWGSASSWTLTALPLFIWMGEILFRTRLSESMFKGLAPWVSRLPGRLLHTNVIGCTIFAAVSGSSAATCATIGKMTLPELGKRGYPEEITIGSLAGAGTLGLLIPPSIIMIVYGVMADVSIARLFVAGIIPGIILAGMFSSYLALWSTWNRDRVPPPDRVMPLAEKLHESRHLIPVVLLIAAVLGSIYSGLATATEAAAVGVVGSLAGAGTLGLLIPPSIIMIVYGVMADVSIARLFVAGIIPGVILAGLFSTYLALWSAWNRDRVPPPDRVMPMREKLYESRHLIPVVLLIAAVLGSIYMGLATATEAAAVGVVGSLIIAGVQRSLTWATFRDSLMGATRLYCMIALILSGAAFLTLSMGYIGLPRHLAEFVASLGLTPFMLILALAVFYIILGCFLDGISMVVLTMGVILPTVTAAKLDLIWFGIFLTIVVEMAQITPPVGFNLFVLQGMTKREITWIAKVSTPLFVLMVVAIGLIFFFPGLVTWLPAHMR